MAFFFFFTHRSFVHSYFKKKTFTDLDLFRVADSCVVFVSSDPAVSSYLCRLETDRHTRASNMYSVGKWRAFSDCFGPRIAFESPSLKTTWVWCDTRKASVIWIEYDHSKRHGEANSRGQKLWYKVFSSNLPSACVQRHLSFSMKTQIFLFQSSEWFGVRPKHQK